MEELNTVSLISKDINLQRIYRILKQKKNARRIKSSAKIDETVHQNFIGLFLLGRKF